MDYTVRINRRRREGRIMKLKKASLLTKLVVLALLIGAATGLLNLRQQILTAEADLAEAQSRVAEQKQVNAELADAVENSGDPERAGRPGPEQAGPGGAGRVHLPFH